MNNENGLKMMLVATNLGCFISDCFATQGYDYQYHRSNIKGYYFDSKEPKLTHLPNWYRIEKYPEKIQRLVSGRIVNARYEIQNLDNVTKNLPQTISAEDSSKFDEAVLENLYEYKYDKLPEEFEDVKIEIQTLYEIDGIKEAPIFDYKFTYRANFTDKTGYLKNEQIHHQLLDEMLFPEILLSERPSKLTSKQMYDITRQYVKEHIDGKVARITSDYDFCFEVKKIIPLLEPKSVTYQDVFARTKKGRNKLHYKTYSEKAIQIFEMTHDQEHYKGYTVIDGLVAKSEMELKEKIDEWLEGLMAMINKPMCQCPHCNGTGYEDENGGQE